MSGRPVGPRRGLVDLRRAFHVESFRRPLGIEDVDKPVEAGLLLQEVGSGGLSGFFLQGEMHAFLAAVLLGMAWLNAFDADAQAQPPHCQLAEIE
jgi:hypothetical protein